MIPNVKNFEEIQDGGQLNIQKIAYPLIENFLRLRLTHNSYRETLFS